MSNSIAYLFTAKQMRGGKQDGGEAGWREAGPELSLSDENTEKMTSG